MIPRFSLARWGGASDDGLPDGYERPRSAEEAVDAFRALATSPGSGWIHVASMLRGKNLACWCKLDQPCHADVLLELANK